MSVRLQEDLSFDMAVHGSAINPCNVQHITQAATIQSVSIFMNIVAFLKSQDESLKFDMEKALRDMEEHVINYGDEVQRKVIFALEQIHLALKVPSQRRYSNQLLATSVIWQKTSPALYRQILEDACLSLPSVRRVQQLSQALTVENGLSDSTIAYLKLRANNLCAREKCVVLIIDEIYTAQRVEFTGGRLFGVNGDSASKTMLGFMLKSVGGKYMDMVALCEMSNLNSQILHQEYLKVVKAIGSVGFDLVAISVDNHTTNQKFFKDELCHGLLTFSIPHPSKYLDEVFLLYDTVHIFKNLYNNFVNKSYFKCPDFDGDFIGDVQFNHVKELFYLEKTKTLKMAHKPTEKVLCQTSIEKTNVKLADAVFHDSTIAALYFFAQNGRPEWLGTSNFLRLIRRWFDIVNVKSINKGTRKRNPSMKPIEESEQDQMLFLAKFARWLEEWGVSKVGTLTKPTNAAARHTSMALTKCASYLLQKRGFQFVLLGLLQSDPIERRFGWYRQLSGANFYVPVCQILQSEKSILLRSLIRFSGFTLKEFNDETKLDEKKHGPFQEGIGSKYEAHLADFECNFELSTESHMEDSNLLFFIAGYLANSVRKTLTCESCVSDLISDTSELKMPFGIDIISTEEKEMAEQFVDQITRGGLCKPSDLTFVAAVHIWTIYNAINLAPSFKTDLLSSATPKQDFQEIVYMIMETSKTGKVVQDHKCSQGHPFLMTLRKMSSKLLGIVVSNFVRGVNDSIRLEKKRSGKTSNPIQAKKISKLQSNTSL